MDIGFLNRLFGTEIVHYDNFRVSLKILLVIVIAYLVVFVSLRIIKRVIKKRSGENALGQKQYYSAYKIFRYLVYTLFLLFCLQTLGIDLSLLIAGSAAMLVGLGLGLQNIFNDIVSGIVILFDGTVTAGDIVEVNGIVGRIDQIDLRNSKLTTRSNINMLIPNSRFTSDQVVNWTRNQKASRFNIEVGVAYGSDVKLVREILLKCAGDHTRLSRKFKPKVQFSDFGDSALMFKLLFWTNDMFEVEFIKSDLRFSIDKAFRENKISIPFPQRDIHIIKDSDVT